MNPYTDTIQAALLEAAGGTVADPSSTAAVRSIAGLLSRAFSVAAVEGDAAATTALTVPVRARIGDSLVRRGWSVWEITLRAGQIRLLEVDQWEKKGEAYVLGNGDSKRTRPSDAVVHVRWAGKSDPPWSGPTGTLLAGIERGLSQEAGCDTGYLVPLPGAQDHETGPVKKLVDALTAGLKGKRITARHPGGGFGNSQERVQDGYRQQRLGIDPPEHLVALRRDAVASIAAACGVPAVLVGDSTVQGEALREALRTALHTFIRPAASWLEFEAADKLGTVSLDFSLLFAADTRARAQALKGMVDAGIELTEARRLTGLD